MRHPQLLVCDSEDKLGGSLRALAKENRWFFRARQLPESCLRLLRRGNPGTLVLRVGERLLGRALVRQYQFLEQVCWLYPTTATVVVCDLENAALISLAWDLGADYVLSPTHPRDRLPEVVRGLMASAIARATRCSSFQVSR